MVKHMLRMCKVLGLIHSMKSIMETRSEKSAKNSGFMLEYMRKRVWIYYRGPTANLKSKMGNYQVLKLERTFVILYS